MAVWHLTDASIDAAPSPRLDQGDAAKRSPFAAHVITLRLIPVRHPMGGSSSYDVGPPKPAWRGGAPSVIEK
jgi:hypothetical protein